MTRKKYLIDRNFIYLIVVVTIMVGVSFITDRFIFRFEEFDKISYQNYYICKVVYTLLLLSAAISMDLFKKKMANSLILKKTLIFGVLFVGIMLIFLLLSWPGIWVWDNREMVKMVSTMNISGWHGLYNHYLFAISLMLFPFPTGINIVQILILGIIASRIFFLVAVNLKTENLAFLSILFFLLPANVYWGLCAYRTVFFGYLVGLAIFEYIYFLKGNDVKNSKIVYLASLIGAIWCIRTEGYAILILSIFICIKLLKNLKLRQTLIYLICFLGTFCIVKTPLENDKGYIATAVLNPLQCMMKYELYSDNLERDLNNIDVIFDVETMKKSEASPLAVNGEGSAYRTAHFLDNIYESQDKFVEMIKSYGNLIWFNQPLFLKLRGITYLYSAFPNFTVHDIEDFDQKNGSTFEFDSFPLTKPILGDKREQIVNDILLVDSKISIVMNNLVFPCILVVALLIYGIYEKKAEYWTSALILMIMGGMVFLTAPASNFMYYYSIYYSMYLFLVYKGIRGVDYLINKIV